MSPAARTARLVAGVLALVGIGWAIKAGSVHPLVLMGLCAWAFLAAF